SRSLLLLPFSRVLPVPAIMRFIFYLQRDRQPLRRLPTRRSSDLSDCSPSRPTDPSSRPSPRSRMSPASTTSTSSRLSGSSKSMRSEEHTSELQSRFDLVCRLLLEKKNHTRRHRTQKNHHAATHPS